MANRWIRRVVRKGKPGALHRALHVPVDQAIPLATLRKAAHAPGKLGRRARFALELRSFRHR